MPVILYALARWSFEAAVVEFKILAAGLGYTVKFYKILNRLFLMLLIKKRGFFLLLIEKFIEQQLFLQLK